MPRAALSPLARVRKICLALPETTERKSHGAPSYAIAPDRVYRSDSDATHTPMFHQIEGLVIDRAPNDGPDRGFHLHAAQRFDHPEVPLDMIQVEHDVVGVAVAVGIVRHHREQRGVLLADLALDDVAGVLAEPVPQRAGPVARLVELLRRP